jgi:tetratricopeptide (TPR) repeat protein
MNLYLRQKAFEPAITLAKLGNFADAREHMLGLNTKFKDCFDFNFYLGSIYFYLGDWANAVHYLFLSTRYTEKSNSPYFMLGRAHLNQEQFTEAVKWLSETVRIDSRNPDAHNDLGCALEGLKRYDDAINSFDLASSLDDDFKDPQNNKGMILCKLNRYSEAVEAFQMAVDIDPTFSVSHLNLALGLQLSGNFTSAMKSLNQSIQLDPQNNFSKWNKSLLLLLLDRYDEAWPLYELRWSSIKANDVRDFKEPLWMGAESIADKKIFIHAEQGFGDVIQCARFIPLLKSINARVTLEVPLELLKLMSFIDGIEVITKNESHEGYDFHCPIMSLPYAFKTSLHNIPTHKYITNFSADKKSDFYKRAHEKNNYLNVGICWSGSDTLGDHYKRSVDLQIIKPLFELPVNFHVIQKEIKSDEKNILEGLGVNCHDDIIHNFFDTASLIDCMDHVISIDTSVAHLSATLNKNTWVLLPYVPDWRWGLDRKDCPWYSTASLYRQTLPGSWLEPLNEIKKDLTKLIKERSAQDI